MRGTQMWSMAMSRQSMLTAAAVSSFVVRCVREPSRTSRWAAAVFDGALHLWQHHGGRPLWMMVFETGLGFVTVGGRCG